MFKKEVSKKIISESIDLPYTNTSFQKNELKCAVNSILLKVNPLKKKTAELIIKADIRKVTRSHRWYLYDYEDHCVVMDMLRDGYSFYLSEFNDKTDNDNNGNKSDFDKKVADDNSDAEELPSYDVVKSEHLDWMMPKQIAYSLGISTQKCSSIINSLNIKSNKNMALPYLADLTIGKKLCWLYNPVIIKMMGESLKCHIHQK